MRDDDGYRRGWIDAERRHVQAFNGLLDEMFQEIELHKRVQFPESSKVREFNAGLRRAIACMNRVLEKRTEELLTNEMRRARRDFNAGLGRVDIPPLSK